jgi:transposase-like protein
MGKRDRYSIRQKESIVKSIIAGRQSISGAARDLGCMRSAIKRWLAQYKKHGVKGFTIRNGVYDRAFKLLVIRHYLGKGLSLNQTASHFNIPNESVIVSWVKAYKRYGAEGLLNKTRGRKRLLMAKEPTKKEPTSSDPAAEKLAALERENAYLRAENAFLKKLEALVQEEKAAKAQARQQKPSGN